DGIYISGSPQYDIYFNKKYPKKSREEFLSELEIPQGRRLILCAPFFNDYTKSAIKIINTLTDSIQNGGLPKDLHLLVRFRPNSTEIPAGKLDTSEHLTITKPCQIYFDNMGGLVKQDYEFTESDVELLFNSLYFSDVTINTISTLSIDAAALDKPVINVRFDAEPSCPKKHSIEQMVGHDHYETIERSGGVALAHSLDQLLEQINEYLKNPSLHKAGREVMRKEQIELMDGKSGERVANFIRQELLNL
ncbi:MAG: CDP-glycerol glycerophosphotransferase family protein, partial [Patescibacteria group bacterium]